MSQVKSSLAAIPLFEGAVIYGVRVVRRSLLGFQIGGRDELLEAPEIEARLEGLRKSPRQAAPARHAISLQKGAIGRILLCERCAGDGLGRRNRGICGLCHGPGIQALLPPGGLAEMPPEDVGAAVSQALVALRAAAYPRARQSLLALLAEALPFTPAPVRELAIDELRRAGFEAAAELIAVASGAPRAA